MATAPAPAAPKAPAPAPTATKAPAAPAPAPAPKKTEAEITAEKAVEDSKKAEQVAHKKAGEINARLARDDNPNRIIGSSRNGKPRYFWGNLVQTRELSDEELEAVEAVK